MSIPLYHILILAGILFAMGLACTIAWRANVIMMLIGIEIMLNAVMLTFVGGSAQWGMADGQIFHTITYGVRNMPSYGKQIPEEDRWAIVAYLRALQRSQRATISDVPESERANLK